MDQKLLYNLAVRFRMAIEIAKEAGEVNEYIREFPIGQCGHISDIFSQYLIDAGLGPVIYVNGTYYGDEEEERCSHTWLEIGDKLVDLTADQFKFNKEPLRNSDTLYVGPRNDWYNLFDTEDGVCHEHRGLEESWSNYFDLKNCYEIIKKYL